MKRRTRFALAVALSGLAGCGSGERGNGVKATEVRELADFDRVSFVGDGLTRITCGGPQSVTVTVDENLLTLVATSVVDGLLTIELLEPIRPRVPLAVDITLPRCEEIEGAGYPFFEVSGLENESFGISIRGNGRVTPLGTTQRLDVSVVGNGDVRATGLVARSARVEIVGNGDVEVRAVEDLHVVIEGNGDVSYAEDPELTVENPGVGSVERME